MSAPDHLSVLVVEAAGAAGSAGAAGAARADLLAQRLASSPGLGIRRGELAAARDHKVVLIAVPDAQALAGVAALPGLAELAYDRAVVVAAPCAEQADAEAELLRLGVQAVVADTDAAELARALRQAHRRKEADRLGRLAYATDLATGLPHQAQLLEHMTQLLALREREAAPLVLIVLRIQGVPQAVTHLGGEAANVLRRKVAVRLRGGLRASDVVASLGTDLFAVMLGRVDVVADGEGVAAKLLRGLEQPFLLAGRNCNLAAVAGLASYPVHGKEAKVLLQRATAQAAMLATVGEEGVAAVHSGFGVLDGGAANDDN